MILSYFTDIGCLNPPNDANYRLRKKIKSAPKSFLLLEKKQPKNWKIRLKPKVDRDDILLQSLPLSG